MTRHFLQGRLCKAPNIYSYRRRRLVVVRTVYLQQQGGTGPAGNGNLYRYRTTGVNHFLCFVKLTLFNSNSTKRWQIQLHHGSRTQWSLLRMWIGLSRTALQSKSFVLRAKIETLVSGSSECFCRCEKKLSSWCAHAVLNHPCCSCVAVLRSNSYNGRTAVDSQKLFDERHDASKSYQYWRHERRGHGFRNRYIANSVYKNSKAGYCSSFQASNYYLALSMQRKIELLEEIQRETKNEEWRGILGIFECREHLVGPFNDGCWTKSCWSK